MITNRLEALINKYNITNPNNIIYGTNIPMPNRVIPTPWRTYIHFDKSEFYFFLFDETGITIYPLDGNQYAIIPWEEVVDFKMQHFLILGKMTIKTTTNIYKFQINRMVIGCPWIKQNTKFLEEHNYFYKNRQQ